MTIHTISSLAERFDRPRKSVDRALKLADIEPTTMVGRVRAYSGRQLGAITAAVSKHTTGRKITRRAAENVPFTLPTIHGLVQVPPGILSASEQSLVYRYATGSESQEEIALSLGRGIVATSARIRSIAAKLARCDIRLTKCPTLFGQTPVLVDGRRAEGITQAGYKVYDAVKSLAVGRVLYTQYRPIEEVTGYSKMTIKDQLRFLDEIGLIAFEGAPGRPLRIELIAWRASA